MAERRSESGSPDRRSTLGASHRSEYWWEISVKSSAREAWQRSAQKLCILAWVSSRGCCERA